MEKCLAHVDQNQHSSVAFPAMGTGNLGYPRETVAKEMFSIVHNFGSNNPSTSISDVYFVLYDRDTDTVKVGTADDICVVGLNLFYCVYIYNKVGLNTGSSNVLGC